MSLPSTWFDPAFVPEELEPVCVGSSFAPASDREDARMRRLRKYPVPNRFYGAEINHEGEAA